MSLIVDISKKLKDFTLNINIDTGNIPTGLLGASGCGKSLTLKCIAGTATPDSGRIVLNDRVLYDSEKGINLPPQKRQVGLLFQNYALFPTMNVRENIGIAIKDKKNKDKVIDQMLEMFRIGSLRNRYPHQLSGGEQQRVAMARMMASGPEVMMFDEPFSALDSYLKDQLQQELLEVLKEFPGDVIMVSHSRDELYRFCKTIVVINHGQMIEIGDKEAVFGMPTDIATAKLTGCKNISRAKKVSEYKVEALDWNITLNTDRYVEDDISYVGIRAHNLKPVLDKQTENVLPVAISGFSEGPFENTIIINHGYDNEDTRLWWIVSKQDWKERYQQKMPEQISLPKEHLLLLKNGIK